MLYAQFFDSLTLYDYTIIHQEINIMFMCVYFLIVSLCINLLQECFGDVGGGGEADAFEADEDAGLAMESGDTTANTGELTFDDFDVIAKLGGEGIVEIDANVLIVLHSDADEVAHLLEGNNHLLIHAGQGLARVIVHEAQLSGLAMRHIFERYRTILILSELLLARVCKKHVRQSGFLLHHALACLHARYSERGCVR